MASVSSLASSLFVGRPQAGSASIFRAASAREATALPTAASRTQQLKATQAVEAQQLALTKGLQSLETALSRMEFSPAGVAGDREEIRENRIRYENRNVYRADPVYAPENITATRDVFETRDVYESRDIVSQRPVYETRDIIETRDVFETRDIIETRDVFETRDLIETRDVYETRDIIETRDVIETRPVYEQQEIRQTLATGTNALTSFSRFSDAGVSNGSEFSVQVGSGSTAVVRVQSATRIRVTVDGVSTNFDFVSNDGSWRTALVTALNSIEGLNASIDTDGHLALEADGAQDLTLTDVTGTPLSGLGFTAGTTSSSVIGYEDVQIGTEDVVVGTEDVVIGTEDVLVGTEDVVVGTEEVLVGTEDVVIGTEDVLVGTEDVVIGTEDVEVGTEDYVSGTEQVVVGTEEVVVGEETYVTGTRNIVTGTTQVLDHIAQVDTGIVDSVLIGFSRAVAPDRAEAPSSGRRDVLEATIALDIAIGRETAGSPFAGLRDALGLDSLGATSTREARDAALAKVRAALESFRGSMPNTSMITLVQAGITQWQGTAASPLAYAAAKAEAPRLGILA